MTSFINIALLIQASIVACRSSFYKLFLLLCLTITCTSVFGQTWNGSISTDWSIAGNWTGGLPNTGTNATIPSGLSRYPIISTGTVGVARLTINSGATLTMTGGVLQVNESWRNSGTFSASAGTVQFIGNPGSGGNGGSFATGTNNFFNVIVNSGIDPDFDRSASSKMNIAGDFTNNNAALGAQGTNFTLTFNGTGAQAYTSASATNIAGAVIVNKTGGTLTLGSALRTGNFTLTAGGFSTSGSNYSVVLSGNATFNGGTASFNASIITIAGTYSQSGSIITAGACAMTVSGNFTTTAGSLTTTGTLSLGGNWQNDNSPTAATFATVTFTGIGKTINGSAATTFGPALPNTTPSIVITTGTISLKKTAICNGGMTFTNSNVVDSFSLGSSAVQFTVNGDVTINQASANTVSHAFNVNAGTAIINGNLTLVATSNTASRTAKVKVNSTGSLTVAGNVTMTNASLAANTVIDLSSGTPTLYLGGNFTVTTLGTLLPGTGSTVVYNGTGAQTVQTGSAVAYSTLTINKTGGTTATVNTALTLTNLNLLQGIFNTTSALNISGNFLNNGGTLTGAPATTFSGSGIPAKTISGTTATIFGSLTFTNGSNYLVSSAITGSSLTLNAGGANTTLTQNPGSSITVNGNATINQPNLNTTVTNSWAINSGTATVTATLSIGGNNITTTWVAKVALTSGTINVNNLVFNSSATTPQTAILDMSGGAGQMNITGVETLTNGTGTLTPGTTSTVNFSGSAAQQLRVASQVFYNNIYINNLAGVTLSAALTSTSLKGDLRIQTGIFNNGGFAIGMASGKTLEVLDGATFQIGGTTGMVTGSITKTFGTTSTVNYLGNNQAVSAETYGHLILSGTSGAIVKTMPGTSFIVKGNFSTTLGTATSVRDSTASDISFNGSVTIGANTTFDAGTNTHTVLGNWVNNGTFTGNTSTIILDGNNTTISGSGTHSFNNLTISGAGISSAVSSITVGGNLASPDGTFTHTTGTLTMSGASKTISGLGILLENLTISGTISATANYTIAGNLLVNTGASYSSTAGLLVMSGASKTLTVTGTGSLIIYQLNITGTITTTTSFTITSLLDIDGTFSASAGTATFTGSSVLSGTANLYNVTLNGTSLRLTGSSILGISNIYTITAGILDVTTNAPNTVHYNGTGAQNILAGTYHHLILSGGNTKTAAGAIVVNGNISIGTATLFNGSTFNHTLYGNWTNSGTFSSTGTVSFLGTSDATITGATTFATLTINKGATNAVALVNHITAATVNMTLGTVNTGVDTLTITTTRTGNGILLGTIQRNHVFNNGTAYEFESPYNTITFTSPVAVTSVTVKVTAAVVADFPFGGSVNRSYTVAVSTGTYASATLRLHYEDAELNGTIESSMQLWKNSGVSWALSGKTANDVTLNYVEQSGLTNITGRWTFSDDNNVIRWTGNSSTDWFNPGNWTAVQGAPNAVPSINDIVQLGTAIFTNQPVINGAALAKSIEFGSVQAVSLSLTGGSLTVQGNVQGTWSANAAHTIAAGSQTVTINGSLTLSDGTTGHTIGLSIGTGTVTILGSLIQTGSASVVFSGAGTLNIGSDYTYTNGTFTANAGTVVYNGSGAQAVAALTYNNLTINKSAGIATAATGATIGNNLSVSSGQLALGAATTVTGNVTIALGATLNGGSAGLSVSGNWVNSGTFNSTGTVTFTGSNVQSIGASAFFNLVVNKSGANQATLAGNLIISGNLTLSGGTLNLSTFSANRVSLGGIFTISNSAFLLVGGAAFPLNYNTYTISATSTVNYNGTVVQSVFGTTYGNLIFSNGAANAKTLAGSAIVNGDLTINSGATLNGSSATLTLLGNWNNSGTFTPATGTVNLRGVTKTITGTTSFNSLTVTNGGSYSIASGTTITITGLASISASCTLTTVSGTVTFEGNVTVNGTYANSGTTNFSGTSVQTLQFSGTALNLNIVNFNGSFSPVLSSAASPTFATVTINNTGGVTPSIGWNVTTTFTVATGATFTGNNLIHTFSGSFTNNGTVSSSGTLSFVPTASQTIKLSGTSFISTGTVNFGGSGAILVTGTPTTLTNVTISNTTGVTPAVGWTISGNFTLNTGGVFNAGANSYTVAQTFSSTGIFNGGTSTFTLSGAGAHLSGNATTTFYDLVISGSVTADDDFNVSRNFTINGSYAGTAATLYMTGSTSGSISGSALTVSIANLHIQKTSGGTVTLAHNISGVDDLAILSGTLSTAAFSITANAGATLDISANSTLQLGGANSLPAFTTYSLATQSNVDYAGSAQTISSATSYGNLLISTAGIKQALANFTVRGNFSLANGTFQPGAFTMNLEGNWTMTSGTFTVGTSTIYFNGTANQTVSSTGAFNNLTVDNATGDLVLSTDITVKGLTFINGNIVTGSFTMIIPSGGTVTGASQATGWVNGNLQKFVSTTSGDFEVGGTTYYSPVSYLLASLTSSGTLTAKATAAYHPSIAGSGLTSYIKRYWTLTKPVSGSVVYSAISLTFNWDETDNYNPIDPLLEEVAFYNGSTWSSPALSGTTTTTSITITGVTTLGDFAVGEKCSVATGFSYSGTPYCSNGGTASVTLSPGSSLGSFSALPAGLTLNSITGDITLASSTAGTYTVTNTKTGNGGCISSFSTNITITAAPTATISYSGSPFCSTGTTANVTRTGSSGGVYSASSGSLVINPSSGQINIASSTAGTYTVTYTIAAANGCGVFQTTAPVTITTAPSATISYTGSPFCSSGTTANVSRTGTAGGTYSASSGSLVIDPGSGQINIASSAAGTYTVTYTVASAGGCAQFQTTTSVTITAAPSATISYSGTPFCSSGTTANVSRTGTAGGTYSASSGLLAINSSNGDINIAASTAGTYTVTYTIAAASGCAQYQTTTAVTIITAGIWTGANGTSWSDGGNWSCGGVPSSVTNVIIPTGLTNYPQLTSGTGAVNNITIQSGASTVVSGATLQISGTISNSGTFTATGGTIAFSGGTAQTIGANTFTSNTLKGLTINNTAGVSLVGALDLTDVLTISGGNITTGGYLKLKSTALGTARIAQITSVAATPISGNVTVERYIQGRRKYRLMTSPVSTSPLSSLSFGQESQSIWGNWQNSGNNVTGNVGTIVTGGLSGDGFDQQTTNASLFTYDAVNRKYLPFTSINNKRTKYTPLKAGVAYYMFIYGDRLNAVNAASPNNTVLSATGTVLSGDQVYTTASTIPLNSVTGRYTMLGNPFASPIDWSTVLKSDIENTFWGWDPNLSSTGGYVTVSSSGSITLISPFTGGTGLNQYIQSGQGFFVRTSGAAPTLTIREQDKVSNYNANAFRIQSNNIPLLAINLYDDNSSEKTMIDGNIIAFHRTFRKDLGKEDAAKLFGADEIMGISNGAEVMSIDGRPLPRQEDTVQLYSGKLNKPKYRLQIFASGMDTTNVQPYLQDRYLKTIVPLVLNDTNWVSFTVLPTDAASSDTGRFRIIFRPTDTSGVVVSLMATKQDRKVALSWSVTSETGIVKHNIERSANGIVFTVLSELTASGQPVYQWLDVNPSGGKNYYRVRSYYANGRFIESLIVLVEMEIKTPVITIAPNPVKGSHFTMRVNDLATGSYQVQLYSSDGKLIQQQKLEHTGGLLSQFIDIRQKLSAGMYYLQLVSSKEAYRQRVIIE